MTLVTCNIRGYPIYFGVCLIPHLKNGHPRVLEVEDLEFGVGFTIGGHPGPYHCFDSKTSVEKSF
ncbi:hypothetical protein ARMGADRAFT_1072447 [Armillaria gallica]|uniref:Uncharacterized protein n=1 Tax=Armillaria gallica TaxID=47427 RepID=A0A2H3E188_ARMGA|nr:hypothetical protein ARMGADRAFT_1072447 [Armillaria gallica]